MGHTLHTCRHAHAAAEAAAEAKQVDMKRKEKTAVKHDQRAYWLTPKQMEGGGGGGWGGVSLCVSFERHAYDMLLGVFYT